MRLTVIVALLSSISKTTGGSYICENDASTIDCSLHPGTILNITYANYGRTSTNICVRSPLSVSRTNCSEKHEHALAVVRELCQEKISCELRANDKVFGDTCPGVDKYLEVDFTCKPAGKKSMKLDADDEIEDVLKRRIKRSKKSEKESKGKDKDTGKNKDKDKEIGGSKGKDKITGGSKGKDKDTGGSKGKDKETGGSKGKDKETGGSKGKDKETGGSKVKDKETGGSKGKDKETGGSKGKDKETGGSKGKDKETGGSKGKDKETGGSKGKDKETGGSKGKDKETGGSKGKDKETGGSKGKDKETGGSKGKDKETGGSKGKDKETGGSKGKDKETGGSKGKDKETGGSKGKDKETGGSKGKDKETGGSKGNDKETGGSKGKDKETGGSKSKDSSASKGSSKKSSGNKDHVFICENDAATIDCSDKPGTNLDIKFANYGRTSTKICVHQSLPSSRTNCPKFLDRALILVKKFCQDKVSCNLQANNNVFGDTCPGTYKYLEVDYTCKPSDTNPCDSSPCKNGGTCIQRAGGYTCSCRFGWSGDHCTERNVCECTASGDPHYKTFDGQMIHFQGVCTYKLAEAWHGTCGMIVHVKNIRSEWNPAVSLTRTMYVIVGKDKIVIERKRLIKINNMFRTAPYETEDYRITRNGEYIIVENRCGMMAMFNGNARVKVLISKEKGQNATGICGNCNDVKDDYRLSDETDVSRETNKYSMIGNSYVVEGDSDTETECTKEDEDIICTEAVNQEIAKNAYCGYILDTTGPFQECLSIVPATDAEMYYNFCAYDVCANWGNAVEQVCRALETFMEYCYDNGADVIHFRTAEFCPVNCEENMVYNPYITDPQPSCNDRDPLQVISLPPTEGCICDNGFVLDNAEGKCIAENECGCSDGDNYYAVGGSFTTEDCTVEYLCVNNGKRSKLIEQNLPGCSVNEECILQDGDNQCICKNGFSRINGICKDPDPCVSNPCRNGGTCISESGRYTCNCPFGWTGEHCTDRIVCECSASGDPHYRTFDGQMIHFQGVCTYKLAEAWDGTCGIIVHVKNIRSEWNPKVSLTRTMYILIGNDKIAIERRRKITINGLLRTAPYETADYMIIRNGEYIVVENRCGMKAMFNGKARVKVIINKENGPSGTGICGNCNDVKDDYRLKNGTDVSRETKKYSMIGNSYVVEGGDETETECTKEDEDIICTEAVNQEIAKNEFCGYILDTTGPFQECLGIVPAADAEMFYNFCAYDVCANWGNATTQVCMALETFMDYCYDNGAGAISFRTVGFCPFQCGENMNYNSYITNTQATCKEHSLSQTMALPPTEGCVCINGFVLDNALEQCIVESDCGCSVPDNYLPVGGTFINGNCTVQYTCVDDGEASMLTPLTLPGCGGNEECRPENGINICLCKNGFTRINGICIEEETLVTTLPPPPPPPPPSPPPLTTTPLTGVCDGEIISIDCVSHGLKYKECPIGDAQTKIKSVTVSKRRFNSLCLHFAGYYKEYTGPQGIYGFSDNNLWVYNGCGATFEVCYNDDICERLKPCHNGGTCTNKGNGRYECCCPAEWSGKHCDIEELSPKPPGPHKECIEDSDPRGTMYFGTQDTTTSGRKCQSWSSHYPHQHAYHSILAGEGNYCRNRLHGKKGRSGPWCYTSDPDMTWEYCDNIPLCSDPTTYPAPPTEPGCYNRADKGTSYKGPVYYTASGKRCEKWIDFPDNYCRNPDGIRDKPWCWTRDGNEDCDIDICALPPPEPGENVCKVDMFVSVCISTTILTGDCYYRHSLYQKCDFTVIRKGNMYDIHMPSLTKELHFKGSEGPQRYTETDCDLTFEVTGDNELTIKYPVCGWCAKTTYESFMKDIADGTQTCPGQGRIE